MIDAFTSNAILKMKNGRGDDLIYVYVSELSEKKNGRIFYSSTGPEMRAARANRAFESAQMIYYQ